MKNKIDTELDESMKIWRMLQYLGIGIDSALLICFGEGYALKGVNDLSADERRKLIEHLELIEKIRTDGEISALEHFAN